MVNRKTFFFKKKEISSPLYLKFHFLFLIFYIIKVILKIIIIKLSEYI